MPIPVGGSGNVDGEGGVAHSIVRIGAVVGTGRVIDVHVDPPLRVWVEPAGRQPWRAIRGARAALTLGLAIQIEILRAAAMGTLSSLAELTDHADDHSTDGS